MSKGWAKPMGCDNCGAEFTPRHHRQVYCARACGTAFETRRKSRGQNAVVELMAWRLARNTKATKAKKVGREALADLCALVDQWCAEDRAAGRPSALEVLDHQRRMTVLGKYPAAKGASS